MKTSMQGDLFEIQGGKIALKKSKNAAVRKLAARQELPTLRTHLKLSEATLNAV